jgi:hypothetical protein
MPVWLIPLMADHILFVSLPTYHDLQKMKIQLYRKIEQKYNDVYLIGQTVRAWISIVIVEVDHMFQMA